MTRGPRVYSRRKGAERPPAGAVYVGRPSKWGNPFEIGKDGTREQVIEKFAFWFSRAEQMDLVVAARRELRGKSLVCWCAPDPCHADVLLEIANADPHEHPAGCFYGSFAEAYPDAWHIPQGVECELDHGENPIRLGS